MKRELDMKYLTKTCWALLASVAFSTSAFAAAGFDDGEFAVWNHAVLIANHLNSRNGIIKTSSYSATNK